jgi:2-polyprenyl-3-methyl-5-hydroxy-6-metoxy-1,4-benzoquinol methylase
MLYQDLHCPACGSSTAHTRLYAKNGCDIFRCEECGIGRADTIGFDSAAYYTGGYFSGQHADGYSDYVGSEPVLRREFARDVEFIRRYRRSGRLIEIGCAYGFLLDRAKSCFEVAGIELADEAAARCRHNGLNVLTGTATAENLGRLGSADVFVLLDVLEHLPDPFDTLARCAGHLNSGGVIVLTTGDFGSRVARLAGARWRLMTPPQHLWFFTEESFRRWACRVGMHIEALEHPWKLVPLSLIGFQLGRTIGWRPARMAGSNWGVPVNLFDAMRVVFRQGASP